MKSFVRSSLDKDPHEGPPSSREKWGKGKVSLGGRSLSDLGFRYISLVPELYPYTWQGGQECFATKNTGIVAALKHHHHPLKYLANSYFGQGGGESVPFSLREKHCPKSLSYQERDWHFLPQIQLPEANQMFSQSECSETSVGVSSKVVVDKTCRS